MDIDGGEVGYLACMIGVFWTWSVVSLLCMQSQIDQTLITTREACRCAHMVRGLSWGKSSGFAIVYYCSWSKFVQALQEQKLCWSLQAGGSSGGIHVGCTCGELCWMPILHGEWGMRTTTLCTWLESLRSASLVSEASLSEFAVYHSHFVLIARLLSSYRCFSQVTLPRDRFAERDNPSLGPLCCQTRIISWCVD